MDVLREGKRKTVRAIIAEPKLTSLAGEKISRRLAGATLAQVQNPDQPEKTVVVVAEIAQGSPAWYARLQKGDIMLSVNRQTGGELDRE